MTKKEIIKHNVSRVLLLTALVATPIAAFAQQTQNLRDLAKLIIAYFNVAVYFIVGLAVLTFVWNVYRYFFKADPENKKDAGLYVMYSVIGFFVILAFWGLVNIVGNTLHLNNNVPSLNFFGGSSLNNGTFGSGQSPYTPGSGSGQSPYTPGSGSGQSPYNPAPPNSSASQAAGAGSGQSPSTPACDYEINPGGCLGN